MDPGESPPRLVPPGRKTDRRFRPKPRPNKVETNQRNVLVAHLAGLIDGALEAGTIDEVKAGLCRLHLAEIEHAARPGDRARPLRELGIVLGIYEGEKGGSKKDPGDMSTLELLQEVGAELGLSQLRGLAQHQLPEVAGKFAGKAIAAGAGTLHI